MELHCVAPHNYSDKEIVMLHDKRRIGDNQNPIQDQAIKLIKSIYENLLNLDKHTNQSWLGKNKTIRDNNALMSAVKSKKILQELESWHKVIEAKDNGEDIHSAPIKSHKLNIVADNYHQFGQYLVDKNEK